MGGIIYSLNWNISPEMAHGVLECGILYYRIPFYDLVIKDFVMKRGVICAGPCICSHSWQDERGNPASFPIWGIFPMIASSSGASFIIPSPEIWPPFLPLCHSEEESSETLCCSKVLFA